jgi:hypothetical protein
LMLRSTKLLREKAQRSISLGANVSRTFYLKGFGDSCCSLDGAALRAVHVKGAIIKI